jgi:hypothetical protein
VIAYDDYRTRRVFGAPGDRLVDTGQGIDDSPVVPCYAQPLVKSVSHKTTFATASMTALRSTMLPCPCSNRL